MLSSIILVSAKILLIKTIMIGMQIPIILTVDEQLIEGIPEVLEMEPYYYFSKNPDLAALHIAIFFFGIGLLMGWVLWAGNRRQLRRMDLENEEIMERLEVDCTRQTELERKSSFVSD